MAEFENQRLLGSRFHHVDLSGSTIRDSNLSGMDVRGSYAEGLRMRGTVLVDCHIDGEIVGAAFQIGDDIIDITSPPTESGKTPGTDLREGVPTLPTLYAQADMDPANARLRTLLAGPITDDDLVTEALGLLRDSQALERTRKSLADYADRARAELATLPACSARDALRAMTDYLVDRTS